MKWSQGSVHAHFVEILSSGGEMKPGGVNGQAVLRTMQFFLREKLAGAESNWRSV